MGFSSTSPRDPLQFHLADEQFLRGALNRYRADLRRPTLERWGKILGSAARSLISITGTGAVTRQR